MVPGPGGARCGDARSPLRAAVLTGHEERRVRRAQEASHGAHGAFPRVCQGHRVHGADCPWVAGHGPSCFFINLFPTDVA